MSLQTEKQVLIARVESQAEELLKSNMSLELQVATVARSIGLIDSILSRLGIFDNITASEAQQLNMYRGAWMGAAKVNTARDMVINEINALSSTDTYDVKGQFLSILGGL